MPVGGRRSSPKGDAMDDFQGLDVADVITKVKYAIFAAQQQVGDKGLPFSLGSVNLELKVVETRDATGRPVFKVPVLDWELGGEVKIAKEQTQTLTISLAPPKETASIKGVGEAIDIPITSALLEIARVVSAAKTDTPVLDLGEDGASVALEFGFTADGKATLLIFEGHLARATTSKLTVKLAPLVDRVAATG